MTSLFLCILLMGWFSLVTSNLYEYKFVKRNLTWKDAQDYCRSHHTDLATVYNMADIKRLSASAGNERQDSWIGLYTESDARMWHWSLPGKECNRTIPDIKSIEHCVVMNKSIDDEINYNAVHCGNRKHPFFCYNESSDRIILINYTKSWYHAQKYCRENHTDLASGEDQIERVKLQLPNNNTDVWIGLFKDFWKWSDGRKFSFRHWRHESMGQTHYAFMLANGEWTNRNDSKEKPFFCYDDKLILVKENKTWQEALDYCRDKHEDLLSITDLHDQRWVQKTAEEADTEYIWLGLRYTCTLGFWFWVDGETLTYKNYAPTQLHTDHCHTAVAMKTGDGYQWYHLPDERKLNVICVKNARF